VNGERARRADRDFVERHGEAQPKIYQSHARLASDTARKTEIVRGRGGVVGLEKMGFFKKTRNFWKTRPSLFP
jgi:predicted RNA methylase